jgi:hypothetical protein
LGSSFFIFNGGDEVTFYEQMVPALSILLEIGETLKAPIYGTLLQKKRNYTFGYLGLSENAILVSLLQGDSKKLKGTSRIPFSNIQKTKVRKSLFPLQYILQIYLTDGDMIDMIKFRISKKVYGFTTQEENLDIFLNKMKTYI